MSTNTKRWASHAYRAARNDWIDLPNAQPDLPGSARDLLAPLRYLERVLGGTAGIRSAGYKELGKWGSRSADCFVDQNSGAIGPYTRWLIVLKVLLRLQERPDFPISDLLRRHDSRGAVVRKIASIARKAAWDHAGRVQELFRGSFPHSAARRTADGYLQDPLFDLLVMALKSYLPDRYGKLSRESVLKVRAEVNQSEPDPDALWRFEHWVLHGFMPPRHDVSALRCEPFLSGGPDSERASQLREVLHALKQPDSDHPIVNIYQRSSWTGLRAFATTLLQQLLKADDAKPLSSMATVLYIPMTRDDATQSVPNPRTLRQALVQAFSTGRPPEPRDADDGSDDQALDLVRRGLTLCETIVVIDAIDCSIGPMAALFDAIKNTQWGDLLAVLAQPHMAAYLARGGRYPSKFVVLSGEPVMGIEAWCNIAAPLSIVPDGIDARVLLEGTHGWSEETKQFCARFGLTLGRSKLRELYNLSGPQLDAVFDSRGRSDLPNETDLALASLLAPADIRACHAGPEAAPADGAQRSHRRTMFGRWLKSVLKRDQAEFTATCFVAAAINGMRYDTLERCMRTWLEQMCLRVKPAIAGQLKTSFLKLLSVPRPDGATSPLGRIAEKYPTLLVEVPSESVEALETRQIAYELQAFPDSDEGRFIGLDRGAPEGASPTNVRMVDLRQNDIRELFFAELLASSDRVGGDPDAPTWREGWDLMQLVLAEEALQQATTQLRTLPPRNFDSSSSLRRLVQAVFHGLLSHRYGSSDLDAWCIPGGALPASADQRFGFLYLFLFKHGIENAPEWALGRAFGRTELRFALLTFFASPTRGANILAEICTWTAKQRSMLHVEPPSEVWRAHDESLRLDITEAYGRAALDSGRVALARAVATRAMLSAKAVQPGNLSETALDPWRVALNDVDAAQAALGRLQSWLKTGERALVPDTAKLGFAKLHADVMAFLGEAADLHQNCVDWLQRAGLNVEDLEALVVAGAERVIGEPTKQAFDSTLQDYINSVRDLTSGSRERAAIADMLVRLAEAKLIRTGKEPAAEPSLRTLLTAYGVYWVADSLRAAARSPSDRASWPMISARPIRHYVRLCFQIARAVAPHPVARGSQAESLSREFYAHGRGRLDAYSRHLFRLPRERASMLLLMADAARTWAQVHCRSAAEKYRHLRASLEYIEEANTLICELGLPSVMVCRLYYDRHATAELMAQAADAGDTAVWDKVSRRDFNWLRTLAKQSKYWEQMVNGKAMTEPNAPGGSWWGGALSSS